MVAIHHKIGIKRVLGKKRRKTIVAIDRLNAADDKGAILTPIYSVAIFAVGGIFHISRLAWDNLSQLR